MFSGLLSNLKWILLVAGIGGPFFGYTSMQDMARYDALKESGTQVEAYITGATETQRKRRGVTRGSSYSVDLIWQDASGGERTATDVDITSGFADEMIVNNEIVIDTVPIFYMEGDADMEPVVVSELPQQKESATTMRNLGFAGGAIGIVGFIAMIALGRRKSQ